MAYRTRVRSFSRDAKLYLLSSTLIGFLLGLYHLHFNLYLGSLGFGQDVMGIMTAIPAFVITVLALPIGFLIERIGYRRAMLLGGALVGVAILAWCFFPVRSILFGTSFLFGIGGALIWVASAPFLTEVAKENERARLFGVQASLTLLSGVAGSAVGGFLPKLLSALFNFPPEGPAAYRGALLFAFSLLLGAGVPIFFIRTGGGRPRAKVSWTIPGRAMALHLALVQGILGFGAGLLVPFVNIFFKLGYGVPDTLIGAVLAANSLLTGLGYLAAPAIAERLGKIRAIAWAQGASLPLLFLWGFGPGLSWTIAGYLLRSSLSTMTAPILNLFAMESVPPALRGEQSGLLLLAWNGGLALGALASGFIQTRLGFSPLFPLTALFSGLGMIAIQVFFRPTDHHSP